ncbi:hypothetical protein C483_02750 [Natrialba hulunbeirensis JCM 10989]|uniref:Uncharacterized protein n=1 Tax=Natrialba hulunbeirensis JCM 10989 TaxID=1227493 RepID=M0A787_9EURY|nr:hypothetical protein C483_02750 [Natrialba hulunbeirensis JCM 10989]
MITLGGRYEIDAGVAHPQLHRSLANIVRFDQTQNLLLQFTANKLDVPCFSLIADYLSLLQFWKMSVVKCDSNALSVFVQLPLCVFVPNLVCNALYKRIVFQCLLRSVDHCVEDGASVFVRYC